MEKKSRKSLLLRIDADLWEALNSWASQDFRSVNGQIELILKRAVDDRRHPDNRGSGRAGKETGAPGGD